MEAQVFLKAALVAVFGSLSVSLAGLAVAASESHTVAVSLGREVILGRWPTACRASLPPAAVLVSPVAAVLALVILGQQRLEIPDLIVRPVAVSVVDLVATRDRAMRAFPHMPVLGDDAAVAEAQVDISVLADPAIFDAVCHTREVGPGFRIRSKFSSQSAGRFGQNQERIEQNGKNTLQIDE
nr:hypothetical protein [uncultured Roseovarius sp.]